MRATSRSHRWATCRCTVVIVTLSAAAGCSWTPADEPWGKTHESVLRQRATYQPKPEYPSALREGSVGGVVVADVWLAPNGRLDSVQIVQAPNSELGEATREALLRWSFDPFPRPEGIDRDVRIRSKLTFYFDSRTGAVLEPADFGAPTAAGSGAERPLVYIDEMELGRLLDTVSPTVVDVRARPVYSARHRVGAINIPVDELASLAQWAFHPASPIVVECGYETARCDSGAAQLVRSGYSDVRVLKRSGPQIDFPRERTPASAGQVQP